MCLFANIMIEFLVHSFEIFATKLKPSYLDFCIMHLTNIFGGFSSCTYHLHPILGSTNEVKGGEVCLLCILYVWVKAKTNGMFCFILLHLFDSSFFPKLKLSCKWCSQRFLAWNITLFNKQNIAHSVQQWICIYNCK